MATCVKCNGSKFIKNTDPVTGKSLRGRPRRCEVCNPKPSAEAKVPVTAPVETTVGAEPSEPSAPLSPAQETVTILETDESVSEPFVPGSATELASRDLPELSDEEKALLDKLDAAF